MSMGIVKGAVGRCVNQEGGGPGEAGLSVADREAVICCILKFVCVFIRVLDFRNMTVF